jgi:gas vesicle protein
MKPWMIGLIAGAGVGVVVGVIIFLLRGEKARRLVQERLNQLRDAVPEPEQVQKMAQQVTERVTQAASNTRDTAQQAMKKVMQAANDGVEGAKRQIGVGS